jgi:hypothetical protein
MAGLEVKCKGVPMGTFLNLARLKDDAEADGAEKLVEAFANQVLISWNLTRSGVSVEPTTEGMLTLELGFCMKLINAWMTNIVSVPAPLGEASPNGSIPMAVL